MHTQVTVPAPSFSEAYGGHRRTSTAELSTSSTPCADHGNEKHLPHSQHFSIPYTNATTAPCTSDGDSVLTCPHCDCTNHLARLLQPDITPRSCTTSTSSRFLADSAPLDLSCPHCHRTCKSRIGSVGHFRIHRTETGDPVPGAPTYTRNTDSTIWTAHAHSHIAWAY
ncbi:unnamed protein product [Schistocephalus solidus]|uniref:C2H2-type domain-containing protein n=1 Tax=Schistocephalus solidus TaxID=70667 RepID=A0A183S8A9_SCHSO|nr:unnamed protein product [Schistocephalus solidus]